MTAAAPAASFEVSLSYTPEERKILTDWRQRMADARADRRQYEIQWQKNQLFAAGIQWLRFSRRDGRVLEVARDDNGRLLDVVDVLSQYGQTAIGRLASGDFRPELVAAWESGSAEEAASLMNDALAYAWEEEVRADRRLLAVLRSLVVLGTCAIRCRYDRSKGPLVGDAIPHENGKPILDRAEQYAAVSDPQRRLSIELRPVREGKIVWEKLSPWNLLPPPGIEDPDDFPWHLICRPVPLDDLKLVYGDRAAGVQECRIEDMGQLAYAFNRGVTPGLNQTTTPATVTHLRGHALVYTGYLMPTLDYPDGQTVVFTHDGKLLAADSSLPYQEQPWGPRPGITYFRWHVVEGRFWGRAFIEPGIGPQRVRNKRLSQIDEVIDRGLPKLVVQEGTLDRSQLRGAPVEIIQTKPGSPKPEVFGGVAPGAWMQADIQLQDNNIEQALGVKQVSLGNAPSGVSAYSAMALLTENDAHKLEPIAQEFRLGVADAVRDTIEAMRLWPPGRKLYIAGEDGDLRVQVFDAQKAIPPAFLVRPAKGAALPRAQAAEVQKIADLANYAATIGAAQADPAGWLAWYRDSLDAGSIQEMPGRPPFDQQHRAMLENALIAHTGEPLPVAAYDDANLHIPIHRAGQMEAQTALDYAQANGDAQAAAALQARVQAIEAHIQSHVQQAQQNAAFNQQAAAGGAGGQTQPPPPPLPWTINTLQTPRMPHPGPLGGVSLT